MTTLVIKKKEEEIIKPKEEEIIRNNPNSKEKTLANKPLMIIGPSGVGKDKLTNMFKDKYESILKKCVSNTTRKMRKNEKEGINYYYISKEKFAELESNNELIGIFKKYDTFYGTSKKVINETLDSQHIIYFDYNIETSIKIFEENEFKFNYIAIIPKNINELEKRLRNRGSDDEETIKKRIEYAPEEIKLIKENESKFINYVIINDKLEEAFKEFESCIKALYPQLFFNIYF